MPALKELSLTALSDVAEDTLTSDPEVPVEPLVELLRNTVL